MTRVRKYLPSPARKATSAGKTAGALLLALSCVGFQANPAFAANRAPMVEQGGTLRIALPQTIVTLDPGVALDNYSLEVINDIFDTLTSTNNDGVVVPRLATAWKANANSTVWDFTIRQGVKFQNGQPMTTADVVATMVRLLNANKVLPRDYLTMVKSVKQVAPDVVRFVLNQSYSPLPSLFTNPALAITPPNLVKNERYFAKHPVGTGPFSFVSWTPSGVTLKANPYYFFGKPNLSEVVFNTIPNATVAEQALETGSTNVISSVVATDIPKLEKEGLFQSVQGDTLYDIVFNEDPKTAPIVKTLGKNPYTNVLVRKAITLAFNVNAAVDAVYPKGLGPEYRAYGMLPRTSWAFDPAMEAKANQSNISEAKKLLAQAGYPNGFKTQILGVNETTRDEMAEIFQADLAQIGIQATISEPEIGQIITAANDQTFDIGVFGWGGLSPDPDFIIQPLLATSERGPGGNNAYYSNSKVDSLILKEEASSNEAVRKGYFDQIQTIVQNDYVYIPLTFPPSELAVSHNVKDLQVSPTGMYNLVTKTANVWMTKS